MPSKPVRLQLSRAKGFDLQYLSLMTNGLAAVNVARPSRWGNPVTKEDFTSMNGILVKAGLKPSEGTWQQHAVKCFDAWIGGEIPEMGEPPTIKMIERELCGKNLACWCAKGEPCHADVLIDLANRRVCDELPSTPTPETRERGEG